jgi:two-component system, NtrC family, response regulator GlrR
MNDENSTEYVASTQPFVANAAPRYLKAPTLRWSDSRGNFSVVVDKSMIAGSAQESQVCVNDRTVSRVHAELDPREDGLWVRDLQSRNGTWIDKIRVSGGLVPNQVKLRLGAVEITVSYDEHAPTPVELWPFPQFGPLHGTSAPMRELFALLNRYAASDAPVAVYGETGTGKELVAKAVHDASPRAKQPFIVIDCAALAETLLDSELFGHTKGAFTGASNARIGAFESADGGTVFLDEIGEVPLSLQPKLLRVLDAGTIRRVGEVNHRPVNVRVLAATHRDLASMVSKGLFREDLFFRLTILPVTVPPLRERRQDIEGLARFFGASGPKPIAFDPATVHALEAAPWPGNVRELRNFVERAKVVGVDHATRMIGSAHTAWTTLPPSTASSQPSESIAAAALAPAPLPSTVLPHERISNVQSAYDNFGSYYDESYRLFRDAWQEEGEKRYLKRLLQRFEGDTVKAAEAAGIDRSYLYRIMRKFDL